MSGDGDGRLSSRRFMVCAASELHEGRVRTVKLFGKTVAVFRRNGEVRAVDGLCRHMNMPLFQSGMIPGDTLTCPFHGWQYDMKTFACIGKTDVSLREYETYLENGRIYVSVPPPGQANL